MASIAPRTSGISSRLDPARLWPLAAMGVMALQILLIFTHEPWMDEWQALQVALSARDLPSLLAVLHYEGHPPLWYLLLRGTALVVPGPYVLPALLLPIALAIHALILRTMALPRWERLAVALNYTVLIEAGSISRSLSLGVLLMIVAFTATRREWRWTAIALLPMADFLFGLVSMIAIALEWREGRLWRPGLLIWAAISALAALSVIPASDMASAMPAEDLSLQLVRALVSFSPQLVPIHIMNEVPTWSGIWYPVPLALIGGPLFLLFAAYLLRDAPFERAMVLLFAGACIAITVFVYWLGIRHFALTGMLLILLRVHADRRRGCPAGGQSVAWRTWLWLGAAGGLAGATFSLIQPFDSGRLMATEINRRALAAEDIVAWPEGVVQGVGVMTGREFTSLSKQCTEGFHLWNRHPGMDSSAALYHALEDYARRRGHFYLISELRIKPSNVHVPMRQIATAPRGYDGYNYHLYELAWDRPRTAPLPRPCAPRRRDVSQWYGSHP